MPHIQFPRSEVGRISKQFGPLLKLDGILDDEGKIVDPVQVMWAFSGNESTFGHDCDPRFEPAYWQGGRYAEDPHQETLNAKYGKLGASSHGIFQIMCCNLFGGFTPQELASDVDANGQAFVGFLNKWLDRETLRGRRPRDLGEMADTYNSGNCRDTVTAAVHEYIQRFRHNYFSEVLG
jgi:hypothetical protein